MNWLMPEPASDIRAQIDALLDPRHPKTAVFAAPGNSGDICDVEGRGTVTIRRPEGALVTADDRIWRQFERAMPDEAGMAAILGYPEPKDVAMAACPPTWLRVVQVLDWHGNVITEALCSPGWLDRTVSALRSHGRLNVMTVDQVLNRRFRLRCEEAA